MAMDSSSANVEAMNCRCISRTWALRPGAKDPGNEIDPGKVDAGVAGRYAEDADGAGAVWFQDAPTSTTKEGTESAMDGGMGAWLAAIAGREE